MILRASFLTLCAFSPAVPAGAAPTAQQLVERLDFVRRPSQSFEVKVTVTEMKDSKPKHESEMRIMAQKHADGLRFDAAGLCLEPGADRGKVVLVKQNEVWFFDPKSKHPTRVSPGQFRGKFFISDAISSSFAADYDCEIDGEETIQDASRADVTCLRLKMHRREKKGDTPETVVYWMDKKLLQPIRGQFYTGNGKLVRTSYYAGYAKVLGEIRPTRVLMVSNTERGLVTDIKFGDFAPREWPAGLFEKDIMPRISRGELP